VLIERGNFLGNETHFFISLIAIDFRDATCEKLQTIEYNCYDLWIKVNKLDSTEFVLNLSDRGVRMCKLVEKRIVIGDPIEVPLSVRYYFDGCFYKLLLYLQVC
jgi:hypothetical protein